ncbi:MAG TPA: extracellular solute-binding protein [Alphaproteobacteria bacterium]|jgi:iron(III) transport system substrate-binding protein|nr:extracellular solute-binding protein [Alphaproteobacteria bacterium]
MRSMGLAAIAAVACVWGLGAAAADLPKSTQAMLAQLKLEPSFMDGLGKELAVPKAWLEAAKKEGTVRIAGSWDNDQFRVMTQPFTERYPFIKFNYMRGETQARVVRPLVALKSGRIIVDVITGIGDEVVDYQAIDAVIKLTDLPAYDSVPEGMKQKAGYSLGTKRRYWCMSYNTDAFTKDDMPKTWDDLLADPKMKGGRLGLNSEAQLWMLPLAAAKGDAWMLAAIAKLFDNLQPQRRRESVNALQGLVTAGEVKAAIPAADYRVALLVRKGAPIAWHCPSPVPSTVSGMVVIKGGPAVDAGRLFANWLVSKEGQVAQFVGDGATPIHRDMQSKQFLAFPEEIEGKPLAFIPPEQFRREYEAVLAAWTPYWNQVK